MSHDGATRGTQLNDLRRGTTRGDGSRVTTAPRKRGTETQRSTGGSSGPTPPSQEMHHGSEEEEEGEEEEVGLLLKEKGAPVLNRCPSSLLHAERARRIAARLLRHGYRIPGCRNTGDRSPDVRHEAWFGLTALAARYHDTHRFLALRRGRFVRRAALWLGHLRVLGHFAYSFRAITRKAGPESHHRCRSDASRHPAGAFA